jgi:hypothetical protein
MCAAAMSLESEGALDFGLQYLNILRAIAESEPPFIGESTRLDCFFIPLHFLTLVEQRLCIQTFKLVMLWDYAAYFECDELTLGFERDDNISRLKTELELNSFLFTLKNPHNFR